MNRMFRAAAAAIWGAALFVYGPMAAAPAHAADAASSKIAVAFVDMGRVMNEAKPISALQSDFRTTRENQQKQLSNLYAGRLLDDKERAELETLQKNANRNAQQNNRMEELAKISDTRTQELDRLMKLAKPTDEERAKATQYSNWLDRQNQRAAQLQEQFNQEAQKKMAEINQKAAETVIAAVKAVAAEKGIEMVVERQAVLYATDSHDLTDAVLQRLNGPAPAGKK